MFEDLITTPKKDKPIVCKYCGSTDIETAKSIPLFTHPFSERYRQFVRCHACKRTYYITNTVYFTK